MYRPHSYAWFFGFWFFISRINNCCVGGKDLCNPFGQYCAYYYANKFQEMAFLSWTAYVSHLVLHPLCLLNYILIIFPIFYLSGKTSPVDYPASLFWETVFPWGVFLHSESHNNMNYAIKSQFLPPGCTSHSHFFDTD